MNTLEAKSPLRLAVLISGGGTTLHNLLAKIDARELDAHVTLVISSTADARGLEFARAAGVRDEVVQRRDFAATEEFSSAIFDRCRAAAADVVVLAGFLKRIVIPPDFHNRVTNIHPALVPSFCGHGFYGHRVHEAVLEYGAKLSGCTVHFADNEYDHGPVILQKAVPVLRRRHPRHAGRAGLSGRVRGLSRGPRPAGPRPGVRRRAAGADPAGGLDAK